MLTGFLSISILRRDSTVSEMRKFSHVHIQKISFAHFASEKSFEFGQKARKIFGISLTVEYSLYVIKAVEDDLAY